VEGKVPESQRNSTPDSHIENFNIFEPGAYSTSILVAHEIGAAEVIKISQVVLYMPDKVCGRTLAPTKHAPDGVTHPFQRRSKQVIAIQATGEQEDNRVALGPRTQC